jgi:pilus assembly protein CpaB
MRRGNMIVLLVAIVIGGIAAFMARGLLQPQPIAEQPAPPVEGPNTIVVAAVPLKFGTVLTKDNITELPWPGPRLRAAFATKEELFNEGRRVVLTPFERHEPIFRPKVTGSGGRAALSSLMEEGKRAVTVRVDDVLGVAGFVLPADHVDVVLIRSESRTNGATETYSDVLIERVKVLAVDQLSNEQSERPTPAKAVTLEVTTEQAQKIVLAANIGKLSLILRQAGEVNPSLARRISDKELGLQEIPKEVPVAAAPVGTATVEIVRGNDGRKYEVKRVTSAQSVRITGGDGLEHAVGRAK